MAQRYLLSIDGGGIRGIIPACALVKLENMTGRLARETFSFVAGTSTGAIIAAGVAAGVPAEQILQFYLDRANEVFPRRPWHLPKRILVGWMYSTARLHDVIAREIGPARDWQLNDSPIDLLITAKRVKDGMPWYFVKDQPGRNSGRTGGLGLIDCVTASAAAPTYFRPWRIREYPRARPPGHLPVGVLIDGGVGVAGNPVYQACVEAFYYTGQYQPEQTTVVSLGTGQFATRVRPKWIWPWLEWIVGELLRSPGEQQTELVHRHFPHTPFYRIDTQLKRDIPLDDAAGTQELRQYGERLAELIDWEAVLAGSDTSFRIGQ